MTFLSFRPGAVVGVTLFAAGACTPPSAARTATAPAVGAAAACTFTNPVLRGADPSVVREGGFYYLVQSEQERIVVYRAARLEDLGRAQPVTVFTPPDTGWNHTNIWAPELLHVDGRWYIYYAAAHRAGQPFTDQRSGVLRARTDDPLGAWEDMGRLHTGDRIGDGTGGEDVWAIDLTVGRVNGRLYAVWSGWERPAATDKTPQLLYIAPMANPWTIGGPRRVLSAPVAAWEKGPELDLQEGPEFLEHGGDTFVVYST
ncbi:MAG TPA: family 43 glycosylhydrolase, partial [Gemmatirosa sp.]